MRFKKGDVVRIVNDYADVSNGMIGSIVEKRDCDGWIGVKFDKAQINENKMVYFHDLSGLLDGRLGRWYEVGNLELVKSKKGNRYYVF